MGLYGNAIFADETAVFDGSGYDAKAYRMNLKLAVSKEAHTIKISSSFPLVWVFWKDWLEKNWTSAMAASTLHPDGSYLDL